jgi:hypothetical protein
VRSRFLRDAAQLEAERDVRDHGGPRQEGEAWNTIARSGLGRGWTCRSPDVATVEVLEAGDDPKQGRLAAAARAEDGQELAVPDLSDTSLRASTARRHRARGTS